jgi:hypothetical protein
VPAAHAALPVVASALEDARSADDGGDGEP